MADAAEQMRLDEQIRNAKIQLGLAQINQIFSPTGGMLGKGKAGSYVPGTPYYNALGAPITKDLQNPTYLQWVQRFSPSAGQTVTGFTAPQGGTGGSKLGRGYVAPSQQFTTTPAAPTQDYWDKFMADMATSGNLYTGQQATEGYGPGFYNRAEDTVYSAYNLEPRRATAEDVANAPEGSNLAVGDLVGLGVTPYGEFWRQENPAARTLWSGLYGRGLGRGSAATQGSSELAAAHNASLGRITAQANAASQGLRQNVQQEKTNLINQLFASADPTTAAQQALAASQNFQVMPPAQAANDLFTNATNLWAAYRLMQPGGGGQSYVPSTYAAATPVFRTVK